MNKYLSNLAKGLEPYVPGEQPKDGIYVKLNTNENPYPPAPEVFEAIKENSNDNLRLYPDPESRELRAAASQYYGVPENMIFAGNGSDEVLAFAFAAFYAGKKIIFPEVTYSFYPVYSRLFDVDFSEIPMTDGIKVNRNEFRKAGCGIIVANPNAPTGELMDLDFISEIAMKNRDDVVLVDEAYIDFGGDSAVGITLEHENLLVVQTFSKSRSLAGMRIGFGIGNQVLIDGLRRIKDSFNSYPLDRVAQAAGVAAFKADGYYREMSKMVINTRNESIRRLRELNFNVLESSANFVFASHKKMKAADIYTELKKRKVLVRYFGKEPIDNYIRITIGTDGQMTKLFEELEKILPCC